MPQLYHRLRRSGALNSKLPVRNKVKDHVREQLTCSMFRCTGEAVNVLQRIRITAKFSHNILDLTKIDYRPLS